MARSWSASVLKPRVNKLCGGSLANERVSERTSEQATSHPTGQLTNPPNVTPTRLVPPKPSHAKPSLSVADFAPAAFLLSLTRSLGVPFAISPVRPSKNNSPSLFIARLLRDVSSRQVHRSRSTLTSRRRRLDEERSAINARLLRFPKVARFKLRCILDVVVVEVKLKEIGSVHQIYDDEYDELSWDKGIGKRIKLGSCERVRKKQP